MNKLFLTLLLSLVFTNAVAPHAYAQSNYDRDEQKVILIAPDAYLDKYWSKSTSPNASRSNTVAIHLGDSHVQGGFFSIPIRRRLARLIGICGTGWAGGFNLAHSNQPNHIRLHTEGTARYSASMITSSTYIGGSPTGTVISSTSKTDQKLTYSNTDGTPINRIVVFRPPSSVPLEGKFYTSTTSQVIGGSSDIATDTLHLQVPSATVTLTVPPRARFYGLSLENSSTGTLLHTIGYNSASYGTYSQSDIAQHMPALHPDLIIISLGTNDGIVTNFSVSDFRYSVLSLIHQIQRFNPNCAIILTSALPAGRVRYTGRRKKRRSAFVVSAHMSTIATELRKIAQEQKIGFIDLYQIFGGDDKFAALRTSGFYNKDGIHLSQAGYTACGEAIADALTKDHRQYLLRQQP